MSWERLQLMAEAQHRREAGRILDLGQLIVAGLSGDADAWQHKQHELINQTSNE